MENPSGVRSGVDADGNKWSVNEVALRISVAVGSERSFDVFIRPGTQPDYEGAVFVVSLWQMQTTFDEHKAVIGVFD